MRSLNRFFFFLLVYLNCVYGKDAVDLLRKNLCEICCAAKSRI